MIHCTLVICSLFGVLEYGMWCLLSCVDSFSWVSVLVQGRSQLLVAAEMGDLGAVNTMLYKGLYVDTKNIVSFFQ